MSNMITFKSKGNFDKTNKFLIFLYKRDFLKNLDSLAQKGVDALRKATPVDSGKTAESWDYSIKTSPNSIRITWTNSNIVGNVPVAILIQYGHATKNGAYVEGRDFINPAMKPIFDDIAKEVWEEVTKA